MPSKRVRASSMHTMALGIFFFLLDLRQTHLNRVHFYSELVTRIPTLFELDQYTLPTT